ncbi:MAG: histidinol-phosphate transaminase [Deltaproteobacteria bacterium]
MSRYWSPFIRALTPYVPGEQPVNSGLVKLNTNENPYAPSPKVLKAVRSHADETLRLYPDPEMKALKEAIAAYYGLASSQVFVGNGSDEILGLAFLTFFKQTRPILFPDITYSFYRVYCDIFQIKATQIPLSKTFDIQLVDYQIPNGGIIFPNPNAPTGKLLPLSAIKMLVQKNSASVVIIDEAYIDFGGESAVSLIQAFPNILVVQTLSKSRSLAGLRVGMAMGHADLIQGLDRSKNSFNSYPLDRLAAVGAVAAIKDDAYFQDTRHRIMKTRDQTVAKLKTMGFEISASAANFIFIRHKQVDAGTLFNRLRDKGILVRYFDKPRINDYLRVTIGTSTDMEAFFAALEQILP